ncbi:diaminopimelate decarboxylase [Haloferax namakaokahaiae]|uniref:Diaminopimelate decarboxylase n=1 Tax=Haloferax namakaokahaiae TaxID=1748331 RepID=A0ABD5ZF51_9EURY
MSAGGPAVRRLADWDREQLLSLADEFGSPLYVTDLQRVAENCQRLRDAFPEAHISYAVKAHTGQAVLETVREAGLDAECASAGELVRAFDAGFEGNRVRYTAVNPPSADLDIVVSYWEDHPNLTITVGAEDTIDRLRERGFDGRLCLRANPGVGAGHHEKVRTGAHAKFGIPIDRVPDIAERVRDEVDLVGVHAHAGSGISGDDLSAHRELVRRMGDLARSIPGLEFVDVGGGFGVPYHEDEPPLDLGAVADATREALGETEADLAIEPGRYVVADAGVLLSEVNTVKDVPETTVVGTDAGMTTLLRPAMYDAYHAVSNLSRPDAGVVSTIIAGPVCETSDVLADDRPLARPERGDLLAFGNAGAYGYEMASTYNSRPRPAEVVLDDDGPRVARRAETIEDITTLERTASEHIPN